MPIYCYQCKTPGCEYVQEIFMGMFEKHPEYKKCPRCRAKSHRSLGEDGRRSSRVRFTPYYEPQLGAEVSSARDIDLICKKRGLAAVRDSECESNVGDDEPRFSETEIRDVVERTRAKIHEEERPADVPYRVRLA